MSDPHTPHGAGRDEHHGHDHSSDSHGQDHSHRGHTHHGHAHAVPAGRAFAVGAAVNLGFVVAEFGFGTVANSTALIADAVHNLGDVLGLLLAWAAVRLGTRQPTAKRTYGWGRGSILAALANAVVLLIGVGAIGVEAVQRLLHPEPMATTTVMLVAAAGIVVNAGSALLFLRDRHNDLNIRAQFMHLASDAVISAGVVAAAFAVRLTGWLWLDPAASLVIAVMIAVSTWGLLRASADLALDAVPEQVSHRTVMEWLGARPGVIEVHDLHIWGLSTTDTALTAHLVYGTDPGVHRMHEIARELRTRFGIGHATLQAETDRDAVECRLRPDHVV